MPKITRTLHSLIFFYFELIIFYKQLSRWKCYKFIFFQWKTMKYYCIEIAFAYCILWEKNVQNKVYNLNYHFIFVYSMVIILKLIKNYVIHYVKCRCFFLIHIKSFVIQTTKALKLVCSVERVLNFFCNNPLKSHRSKIIYVYTAHDKFSYIIY